MQDLSREIITGGTFRGRTNLGERIDRLEATLARAAVGEAQSSPLSLWERPPRYRPNGLLEVFKRMPIVQVEAQLSIDELLKAVDQLSFPELEQFVFQVIAL